MSRRTSSSKLRGRSGAETLSSFWLARTPVSIESTVDAIAAQATIIEPDKTVVTKVLNLLAVKSLKPFDKMILGAVLTKASELYQSGERDLWFCNLNKKDFDPANQSALADEYAASTLQFYPSFAIP